MDFTYPAEAETCPPSCRGWLDAHVTDEIRALGRGARLDPRSSGLEALRAWNRELADAGYAAISWPVEYGGRGAGVMDQVVWNEELHRSGAPAGSDQRARHPERGAGDHGARHRGPEGGAAAGDPPR